MTDLEAIIANLFETIDALTARIERLEERLGEAE